MPDENAITQDQLSDEARLALAYTPQRLSKRLETVLLLDRRLARIVSATTEAMLGQLRLAWWREALEEGPAQRPHGDRVLDAVGEHLRGREAALVRLVDGWEHVLGDSPLGPAEAQAFAAGRSAALAAVFDQAPGCDRENAPLESAAHCWALGDLAANVSAPSERDMLIALGLKAGEARASLHREARGIAILGALGHRALRHGGRPLMEGRGAALIALRAGLLGR